MPQYDETLFDIKTAYEVIRNDESSRSNAEGIAFYDKLLESYGPNALLVFLKNTRPLLQANIDFETKHLASQENVIFSLLEENHYPLRFRGISRFLDFKAWGLVGLGFFIESSLHLGESGLKELGFTQLADKIHKPLDYLTIFALYLCAMAIMYEFYEKRTEFKILQQIEFVSHRLLLVVPKQILDSIPVQMLGFIGVSNTGTIPDSTRPTVIH